MGLAEPARWHGADAEHLAWVELDSLSAVYDRRSGQTHLLGSPAREILAALQSVEMDAAELLSKLAADFDLSVADDGLAALDAILAQLAALGLIECRATAA